MKVKLPYGDNFVEFEVPEKNLLAIVSPNDTQPALDADQEITRALDNPIGMKKIEDIAKPEDSVVLLVDDNTRFTPCAKILPEVIKRLDTVGVKENNIKIIIATGTHRSLFPEEIERKVGAEIVQKIEVLNHNWKENLVYVGKTSQGTRWI